MFAISKNIFINSTLLIVLAIMILVLVVNYLIKLSDKNLTEREPKDIDIDLLINRKKQELGYGIRSQQTQNCQNDRDEAPHKLVFSEKVYRDKMRILREQGQQEDHDYKEYKDIASWWAQVQWGPGKIEKEILSLGNKAEFVGYDSLEIFQEFKSLHTDDKFWRTLSKDQLPKKYDIAIIVLSRLMNKRLLASEFPSLQWKILSFGLCFEKIPNFFELLAREQFDFLEMWNSLDRKSKIDILSLNAVDFGQYNLWQLMKMKNLQFESLYWTYTMWDDQKWLAISKGLNSHKKKSVYKTYAHFSHPDRIDQKMIAQHLIAPYEKMLSEKFQKLTSLYQQA